MLGTSWTPGILVELLVSIVQSYTFFATHFLLTCSLPSRAMTTALRRCTNSSRTFARPTTHFATACFTRSLSRTHVAMAPQVKFAEGSDEAALAKDLDSLVSGKWTLTDDGQGIERPFKFKTFAKTWDFMTAVSLQCKLKNHHPEWSNVSLLPMVALVSNENLTFPIERYTTRHLYAGQLTAHLVYLPKTLPSLSYVTRLPKTLERSKSRVPPWLRAN